MTGIDNEIRSVCLRNSESSTKSDYFGESMWYVLKLDEIINHKKGREHFFSGISITKISL